MSRRRFLVDIFRLISILIVIVTAVSSWLLAVRMRRRIRRALSKEVSELELTSMNTWMDVSDAEERLDANKPIEPK